MQQDGSLPHAGPGDDGFVPADVGQFGVNLVADHEQVLLHANLGQSIQFRTAQYRPGRVGRKIQEQNLGAGRGAGYLLRIQPKTIIGPGVDGPPLRMGQGDGGGIGHIAGLVIKDGFPGIEHCPQRQVDRLADTDRNKNFRRGIVRGAEDFLHVATDFPTKF